MASRNYRSEQDKIRSYRYLHANMRLRTRYGIEIPFEKYTELCDMFKRQSPKIIGLRTNELGDREGWVQVKGVWVCAHYKVSQNLIATFMPAPPPLEIPATPPATPPEQPPGGSFKKDLSWVLKEIAVIEATLVSGEVNEAKDRLQVLVRLARDTHHPGQLAARNAVYDAEVKAAMESRAYWNQKFDPNHPEKMLENPCPQTIPATATPTTLSER